MYNFKNRNLFSDDILNFTGKGEIRKDEEWDVRARWAGVKYYYEKNNMLWLYDLLYGDTVRF